MKLRTSTLVLIGAWFATLVLYVLVRPDNSSGLPLNVIPFVSETQTPVPTTTTRVPSTTDAPTSTSSTATGTTSTTTESAPTE